MLIFFIAYWLSVSIVRTEKQCKSMTKRLLRNIFVDQACFWTKSAINPELKTVVVFYISILYIFGLPQIYYMIDCFPNVNGQSWLWSLQDDFKARSEKKVCIFAWFFKECEICIWLSGSGVCRVKMMIDFDHVQYVNSTVQKWEIGTHLVFWRQASHDHVLDHVLVVNNLLWYNTGYHFHWWFCKYNH